SDPGSTQAVTQGNTQAVTQGNTQAVTQGNTQAVTQQAQEQQTQELRSCSSRKGLNGACSVHEYMGTFSGQSVRFKMTSVCGHVMSLDFIGKYNNWDKVDPAELFTKAPTEKKEANPKLNMVKFLQVEAKGCDYVVLWLDCDKEGENICFEVIPMLFQTKYFQGKYGNLDSSLISFGPCQTPTLGFCVFKGKESPLTLDWDRVRVFDREVGQMFVNMTKTSREAKVKALLSEGLNRPRKGADAGDHPPITPMRAASEGELGGQDCKYLQTTISFIIASEGFSCSGKTLISPGFTEVMPWLGIPLEEAMPVCERGDVFTVEEIKLRNYVTVENGRKLKPTNLGIVLVHGYYKTDAELVLPTIRGAVEKQLNLIAQGKVNYQQVLQHTLDIFKRKFHYFFDTIASMDELMEVTFSPIAATGKPLSRCGKCHRFMKYIQSESQPASQRASQPVREPAGQSESQPASQRASRPVKRASRPASQESQPVSQSESQPVKRASRPVKRASRPVREPASQPVESQPAREPAGEPASQRDNQPVKDSQPFREPAKPSRLHCAGCDETYSLPQNGAIKLYKELRCPLDEFELVLWTSGSRGKSYPLCPYCFSNPPFRDMKKGEGECVGGGYVGVVSVGGMGCNECTHPSCQHSLNSLGIGQCVECEGGVLVLDPTSGPKWKMSCNRCNVAQESCEACEASLVAVDFNKTRSPLPDGETQHSGCVFCDPVFQDLVELKHATMRHPSMTRGGGARRGGRGRGRGRREKKPKDKMAALAAYFV
ncbi:unnamed protein product, partial [Coregonus sp. 'balchen']